MLSSKLVKTDLGYWMHFYYCKTITISCSNGQITGTTTIAVAAKNNRYNLLSIHHAQVLLSSHELSHGVLLTVLWNLLLQMSKLRLRENNLPKVTQILNWQSLGVWISAHLAGKPVLLMHVERCENQVIWGMMVGSWEKRSREILCLGFEFQFCYLLLCDIERVI